MPGMQKDDVADDVRAAFNEVSAKAEPAPAPAPTPEPAPAPEKVETAPETPEPIAKDNQSEPGDGPSRDEKGRFASKGGKPEEGKAVEVKPTDTARQSPADVQQPPSVVKSAGGPVGGPPTSWTIKSKAAWEALPEAVRADIVKREGEVQQGLAALRDYKDLKPYAERAQREGTTIKGALDHYLKMEDLIRRDVGAGLAQIAQNYGLSAPEAAQMFAGLAQKFGGGQAPQPQGGQQTAGLPPATDPLMQALAPVMTPLMSEVNLLKQQLQARADADRNAQVQSLESAIQAFAAKPENRYFADLEDSIVRLFESGYVKKTGNWPADIQTAYDLAMRMNPEISEALIEQRLEADRKAARQREQEAAEKAKAASRSITGAAAPGTIVKEGPARNGHDDIHATVVAAYRQHAQQ